MTEHDDATLLARWLTRRRHLFLHVPNEGLRSYATANALREEGMQSGAPDYLIFEPRGVYVGAALELKKLDGQAPNAKQRRWLRELAARGWWTGWAKGWRAATEKLEAAGW